MKKSTLCQSDLKKVLILGGKAVGSVDIVHYLQQKGYYVIVTDYLPPEQSPAKVFADECLDISTAEVDLLAQYVIDHGVCGVFTGIHDFNLHRCREVCEKTGLPFYAEKKDFEITLNKREYKKIFASFHIPVIPEFCFSADNIPDDLLFPLLLKPVDGCGAYGVQLCYSDRELREKLDKTLQFSEKKDFIAEQYIAEKKEITVVYMMKNGIPYLSGVADRIVKSFDHAIIPLPIAYIWDSEFLELYENNIDQNMKKALQSMGLQNGMVFIQCIVKDDIILPYDLGFRASATQEHIIFEAVCGYNPLKLLTDYAVTGKLGDEDFISKINPHFPNPAGQVTFLIRPGTVGSFYGLEKLENVEGIIRVVKNKQIGETVPQTAYGTLNQIALRVFLTADTKQNLREKMDFIRKSVSILSADGENLLI